jgi:acetyltransferase-like isoleucine patch superfamily enzyme
MFTLKKLTRRVCRTLLKSAFPNSIRIFLLKCSGVIVGKDVAINEGFTLACDIGYEENIVIEDRVAFGPNTTIVTTSHPNKSKLMKLKNKYDFIEIFGKVYIKHDSWIGAGVTILPKTEIGEFSVIGANSVVTRDIPPYSIAVGAPAKVIRNFAKEDIIILNSRYISEEIK